MARIKRASTAVLAVLAFSSLGLVGVAQAHNSQVCAFTSTTGLPAKVNNVEGKGAPWTIDATSKWWTGTSLTATTTDGFGHPAQALQDNRRGLYYPVTDPNSAHLTPATQPIPGNTFAPSFNGDHFNWDNSDQCNNSGAPVNTKGVGVGYCGRSVGIGSGTIGTGTGHPVTLKWESLGTQLLLVDPSALGSLNAQANPPGSANGSCLNGTAVVFNLNGAILY